VRHLRAVIAVSMLGGFYLLALAMVGGFLAAGVWVAVSDHGAVGAKLILFGGAIALLLGRVFWLVIKARPGYGDEDGTMPLTEAAQPELWREVRALAAAAGTRPPDEIRLSAEVNAGVTEQASFLGLRGGPRTLYLGVPLLIGLDADQLRSVLAHELGHYSGAHTRLGGLIYRGAAQLELVIAQLDDHVVVRTFFKGYRTLYMAVSSAVRRQQELEADAASAQLVGPSVAASALRELAVIDAAWSHYAESYLGWAFEAGVRPAEVFEGFGRLLVDPGRAKSLAQIRRSPQHGEASRYDSHPPVSRRVAALAQYPGVTRARDTRPALALLEEPGDALRALVQRAFTPEVLALPELPWPDIAPRAGQELVRPAAAALQAAADGLLEAPATLADVLHLFEAEELGLLGNLITYGRAAEGSEQARGAAVEALAGYVSVLAVDAGAARWELTWSGPVRLLAVDGSPVGVSAAARELLEPGGGIAPLREVAKRLGLPATASYGQETVAA
jgi:Zn-dependent protease with chaperone function